MKFHKKDLAVLKSPIFDPTSEGVFTIRHKVAYDPGYNTHLSLERKIAMPLWDLRGFLHENGIYPGKIFTAYTTDKFGISVKRDIKSI